MRIDALYMLCAVVSGKFCNRTEGPRITLTYNQAMAYSMNKEKSGKEAHVTCALKRYVGLAYFCFIILLMFLLNVVVAGKGDSIVNNSIILCCLKQAY